MATQQIDFENLPNLKFNKNPLNKYPTFNVKIFHFRSYHGTIRVPGSTEVPSYDVHASNGGQLVGYQELKGIKMPTLIASIGHEIEACVKNAKDITKYDKKDTAKTVAQAKKITWSLVKVGVIGFRKQALELITFTRHIQSGHQNHWYWEKIQILPRWK
jgi:hypothetical protein